MLKVAANPTEGEHLETYVATMQRHIMTKVLACVHVSTFSTIVSHYNWKSPQKYYGVYSNYWLALCQKFSMFPQCVEIGLYQKFILRISTGSLRSLRPTLYLQTRVADQNLDRDRNLGHQKEQLRERRKEKLPQWSCDSRHVICIISRWKKYRKSYLVTYQVMVL